MPFDALPPDIHHLILLDLAQNCDSSRPLFSFFRVNRTAYTTFLDNQSTYLRISLIKQAGPSYPLVLGLAREALDLEALGYKYPHHTEREPTYDFSISPVPSNRILLKALQLHQDVSRFAQYTLIRRVYDPKCSFQEWLHDQVYPYAAFGFNDPRHLDTPDGETVYCFVAKHGRLWAVVDKCCSEIVKAYAPEFGFSQVFSMLLALNSECEKPGSWRILGEAMGVGLAALEKLGGAPIADSENSIQMKEYQKWWKGWREGMKEIVEGWYQEYRRARPSE